VYTKTVDFSTGNKALHAVKKDPLHHSTIKQEQSFHRNPRKFAQAAYSPSEKVSPKFSADQCPRYFELVVSPSTSYGGFPERFGNYQKLHLGLIYLLFVPVKSKEFSSASAPDDDGVTYFHLKNLPSCHKFLTTLYSKVWLQSHSIPHSWCQGKTILLYKKGYTSLPKKFHLIILMSVVGKLFHRILSLHLEKFVISNKILDS